MHYIYFFWLIRHVLPGDLAKFKTIFLNQKRFFSSFWVNKNYLTISDSFCKLKCFRELLVEITEQFFCATVNIRIVSHSNSTVKFTKNIVGKIMETLSSIKPRIRIQLNWIITTAFVSEWLLHVFVFLYLVFINTRRKERITFGNLNSLKYFKRRNCLLRWLRTSDILC